MKRAKLRSVADEIVWNQTRIPKAQELVCLSVASSHIFNPLSVKGQSLFEFTSLIQ
jgi:hypothetical protein